MTRRIAQLITVGLFALPFTAQAQAGTHPDSAARAERAEHRHERREEARDRKGKGEAHPQIRAAIRALERAKTDLEHASHDFGGHRADALRSVDESIKQLNLALEYDKK